MEISYQTGSATVTSFGSRAQLLYSRKRSGDQVDQICDTSVKPAKIRHVCKSETVYPIGNSLSTQCHYWAADSCVKQCDMDIERPLNEQNYSMNNNNMMDYTSNNANICTKCQAGHGGHLNHILTELPQSKPDY